MKNIYCFLDSWWTTVVPIFFCAKRSHSGSDMNVAHDVLAIYLQVIYFILTISRRTDF